MGLLSYTVYKNKQSFLFAKNCFSDCLIPAIELVSRSRNTCQVREERKLRVIITNCNSIPFEKTFEEFKNYLRTLNVGCGSDTWGDIRLDVERSPPDYFLYYKKSTANIIADTQNLPFRDEVFTELRANQVLEHLPNPIKALKEWRRVACMIFRKQ